MIVNIRLNVTYNAQGDEKGERLRASTLEAQCIDAIVEHVLDDNDGIDVGAQTWIDGEPA